MRAAILGLLLLVSTVAFSKSAFSKAADVNKAAAPFTAGKNAYANAKPAANPEPEPSLDTIMPWKDFVALSHEQQVTYLEGVRLLMTKLASEDESLHTEYQSASILDVLFTEAIAKDDNDRRCVYAGMISEMDINGRYCMAPRGTCKTRGQVMCNPVLYGVDRCAPSGRAATSWCQRNKRPDSDIIKTIKDSKDSIQAYSNLRSELGDYCAKPRPTQKQVCAMIRSQMARLDRVIGKVPPPKYETPTRESASAAPRAEGRKNGDRLHVRRPGAAPNASETSDDTAQDIVVSAVTKSSDAKPTDAKPSAKTNDFSLTRTSGTCVPAWLVGNMKPESIPNAQPYTFMSLTSAKTLMCSVSPIPDSWLKDQEDIARKALAQVSGNAKYAKDDRINFNRIISNYAACLGDAKKLRNGGSTSVAGQYATIVLDQDASHVSMYDQSGSAFVGEGGGNAVDLEGLLRAKGVSICNTRIIDNRSDAGDGQGPASSNPASTGSAQ